MASAEFPADFSDSDHERCVACPWCGSPEGRPWGEPLEGTGSRVCSACDVIYLERRLVPAAQERYYRNYLSEVHEEESSLPDARREMYELEYALVAPHLSGGRVLDVGCSRGGFLESFAARGFECVGVELGEEAGRAAAERFEIHRGELPEVSLPGSFDVVLFRGVIEHTLDPRRYLDVAWSHLNPGGVLYITSTPNRDAVCCDLFEEHWNQHDGRGHLFHLACRHLDEFFAERQGTKLFERYLYEETPYANPVEDIARVHRAMELRSKGQRPSSTSPAFWGNMLSVAYRRPGAV